MRTHLSGPFIELATATPALGKFALTLAAHTFPCLRPNWALQRVAIELDYRIPVNTHLGNGMKIRVVWSDVVGRDIRKQGYYEPPTVRLVQKLVRPGMVFIDAGAHVGQYTLVAAGLGASVHSFEPDPRTFELLQYNIQTNALTNVRLNQCALLEAYKNATLQAGPADNIGGGSLSRASGSKSSFSVRCRSLDSYVVEHCIAGVHFIKIDVEGAELDVMRGAQSILSQAFKPQIIIEFGEENQARFGSSCSRLAQFLTELGYRLFRITDSGLVDYIPRQPEERFFNVLARPGISRSA